MYTNKAIRLHSKALHCLDLIQQCNNRIEEYRSQLNLYDRVTCWHPIRLMNTREEIVQKRDRKRAVKDRLVIYYANVMQSINEEIFNRIQSPII